MARRTAATNTNTATDDAHYYNGEGDAACPCSPGRGWVCTTEFIGAIKGNDPAKRTDGAYSNEIGKALKSVTGASASYTMTGDELYVRAVIRSTKLMKDTPPLPDLRTLGLGPSKTSPLLFTGPSLNGKVQLARFHLQAARRAIDGCFLMRYTVSCRTTPMTEETIGGNIRTYREKVGLTLTELALRAGLTKGALSKIETGRGSAAIATILRIAEALGRAPGRIVRRFRGIAPRMY